MTCSGSGYSPHVRHSSVSCIRQKQFPQMSFLSCQWTVWCAVPSGKNRRSDMCSAAVRQDGSSRSSHELLPGEVRRVQWSRNNCQR